MEASTSLRSLGRISVSSNGREGNVDSAIENVIPSINIMNNILFLAIRKKSESYDHLSEFVLDIELNLLYSKHNRHDRGLMSLI